MSAIWEDFWMAGSWAAGQALTKSLADTVTGADATTRAPRRVITDAVAGTDAAAKTATHALTDSVASTDAAAKTFTSVRADATSVADVEQTAGSLIRAIGHPLADAIVSGDAHRAIYTLAAAADTVALADDLLPLLAGARTLSLADVLTADDAATPQAAFFRVATDSLSSADSAAPRASALTLDPVVVVPALTLTPWE